MMLLAEEAKPLGDAVNSGKPSSVLLRLRGSLGSVQVCYLYRAAVHEVLHLKAYY